MIKFVKAVRQLIDIGADLVGSKLLEGVLQNSVEPGQHQLQRLLALILRRRDPARVQGAALSLIFIQDGLDADDGIQNVRTCISLKGGKPVDIKHIILGRLIGQVAVFDSGQAHDLRGLFCLLRRNLRILRDLLVHLLVDVRNQVFQTHDAALTGLEGLAVLAVHGAKAQEPKLCLRLYDSRLLRTAEHLDKMHLLALIHHIDDLVRIVKLPALHQRRQIRRRVKRSPVGFQNHAGGNLLRIRLFLYVHHQSAVALVCVALLFQPLHHVGNVGLGVGLALPQIEIHIQVRVIAL